MKKLIIGGLVGGILIFLWQSLSWTVLDLHHKEYQKAGNQDSIMAYLNSQFTHDGQYYLPNIDRDVPSQEREKFMEDMKGKPWAVLSYHKSYSENMVKNVLKGLAAAIIAALFACWILMKQINPGFGTTFISTLLIGLAGFLFIPFSNHNWFQVPGFTNNVIDTLVSWGLCGIWLGWWINRK